MPFSYDIDLDDTARAKRRRRSPSSESIDTKALGANLGALARGTAVFDPNAYDGDGDGLVQDNTPFERPAVLSNIAAVSRGFASATGKWGDSFTNWTEGKTNEEIAEIVVPDNPADLLAYITAHVGAYGLPSGFDNINDLLHFMKLTDSRFDPETIAKTRAMVVRMLENNPEMRTLIDRHGIPAVVVKPMSGMAGEAYKHVLMSLSLNEVYLDQKDKPKWRKTFGAVVDMVNKRFGDDVIEAVTPEGVDALPDTLGSEDLDNALENTFIHEYGHYLHYQALLNHPDPKVREEMFLLYNGSWSQLESNVSYRDALRSSIQRLVSKIANPLERKYKSWDDKKGIRRAQTISDIMPPSAYAITAPVELMAELFVQYIKAKDKKSLNAETRNLVETLTGDTGIRGFASSSRTLPASLDMVDMTPEELAEAAVPSTPEEAMGALSDWAQWSMDLMGPDYYDDYTEGMSALERAKSSIKREYYYAFRGLRWLKALKKSKKHKGDIAPEEVFDLTPETVAKTREALARSFREHPDFFEHAKAFGMPPIFVSRRETIGAGAYFQGSTAGIYIMVNPKSLEASDKQMFADLRAISPNTLGMKGLPGTEWYMVTGEKGSDVHLYTHEYGHYINYLAQMSHPDRTARYLAGWYWRHDWDAVNPKGIKGYRFRKKWAEYRKRNPHRTDRADIRWRDSAELERAIKEGLKLDWENGPPHILSEYGQSSPAEMFAEAYGALVSNDPEQIARVSPALREDIEIILGRVNDPDVMEVEVDTSQSTTRTTGFASLSITRNEDGTRDMARAFSGEDDSPLSRSDWLRDATPREIAQALVPRTREDLVNLSLQHMLMGNTNPDPHVLAALKEYVEAIIDHDLFDFSPEGVAKMEQWLEKTLNESPQFLWTVRRFGSSPIIPIDKDAVERYRNARRNNQTIRIPSTGARSLPVDYPIPMSGRDRSGQPAHTADEEAMNVIFRSIVNNDSVLGFNFAGLFTVINTSARIWQRGEDRMPRFGRTRRVRMGGRPGEDTPYPDLDSRGRFLISNFSTSIEGTIVHEWHHQMWASLFGLKRALGILPQMRDRVARAAGVNRRDLEALSGDRYSRAAYLYPDLPIDDALERMTFARNNVDDSSLSIIPSYYENLSGFIQSLQALMSSGIVRLTQDQMDDIKSRVIDYMTTTQTRGLNRLQNAGIDIARSMVGSGLNPTNRDHVEEYFYEFGWDPVEMEDTWRGLAQDYPDVFGDPRLPFAGLAGQYAQKNPQETWAELGALMSQPDADYRDEYITPEMIAPYLYIMGAHGDPYDVDGIVLPWQGPGASGFASTSRANKVMKARETVPKRSSNALGNIASTGEPVDSSARRVTMTRGLEGHTYFALGDYKFKIPGDRFMPEISNAYTEWASDSHYDIQHISGMAMGLQRPSEMPSFLRGNTAIGRLLNGGKVSELDSNTLTELRSSASRTKRIMDEVRDSETYSSIPLYHTMSRLGENNELLKAEVNDPIYMPLTSFSPAILAPDEVPIATMMGGGDRSAIVKLAIGASVFESNLLDNVSRDGEWRDMPIESITGGRFKVVSKREKDGIPYIEIEHTDVFDADKGEFVNVDPKISMDSVKDIVLVDRGIREIEALHDRRRLVEISDPAHDRLTREINNRTESLIGVMFGDVPEPTMNLSQAGRASLMEEIALIEAIPISSMDKVDMPGFASTSREMGFNRIIRPERRVAKSAIRTLEENREYIEDRMMSGRTREVLDGEWIDQTIERLNKGEITHTDAMDIMNIVMDIVSDRIRRDPSVRDATDGDIYHYQKLGKRLRRAMVSGLSDEDLKEIRVEQGIEKRRPGGFASTSSNTRSDIVGRFNPTVRSGEPDEWEEGQFSREVPEVIVYEINGEKVVFGVEERHNIDVSNVKNIPLNPYEITGLARGTKEGDEMARIWAYAHIGSDTNDLGNFDSNSTEMSALLYAAVNGDEDALRELKGYAEKGKRQVEAERQALIDESKQEAEKLRADQGFKERLLGMKYGILNLRKKRDTPDYPLVSPEEADEYEITTKDLVLVRWSEFPPEYDEDGNVVLGPAGDYIDFDRETIHFTLNHSVEPHIFWQQEGSGYLVMIPLSDVLEDNGTESLGNLYGVDTYFTPKPGEKLKLRKGSVVVREVSEQDNRQKIASQMLREDFATISVRGLPSNVDYPGFDDLVLTIAADLGLRRGALHSNRGHSFLERINNPNDGIRSPLRMRKESGVYMSSYTISDIDDNSFLRHIDRRHGKPIGVSLRTEDNPDSPMPFFSASRPSRRDLSSRVKDPQQAEVVRSIERRLGFASRSDAVNPSGKTSDEIARDLELTPREKEILVDSIPDYEELKKLLVNPSITEEQRQEIIDSIRVRIEDGIPYITIAPHPLVIDEIPDKRDWSTVVVPSKQKEREITDLLERMGEKVPLEDEDVIKQRVDEVKLNTVVFSTWLMDMWKSITAKNPLPPGVDENEPGTYVLSGSAFDRFESGLGNIPTGFTMYFQALYNMGFSGIREFFGDDDFLNAHDLWGHVAIGRGFDRHGEWANMLAIFSLMDRWGEENDIPEIDVLRMKATWFSSIEYLRFGDRFVLSEESEERGIVDVLGGMGEEDDLRELIRLLDHGRVHDSANSKGFASASRDERASIVATDIVRQSRRLSEMDLPTKGEETGDAVVREMGLTGKAAQIAKQAFQRSLESISSGRLKKYKFAKGVDEHKSRIIDSIRIVISADDVPMIMADPHPVFFRLLTDRRNWSSIEVPSDATVTKFLKRLKEGNNPLSFRGQDAQRNATTGREKFEKWVGEKLKSLIDSASRQDVPSNLRGSLVSDNIDLDDELRIFAGDSSWINLFVGSLVDGRNAMVGAGDTFDLLHEAIGHVAIGRGFDRHGEYTNGLAVLSLLKHPEVQKLLTKDEIQQVARHIMSNYLVDRLEQARPDAVASVLDDGKPYPYNRSRMGELMQIVREYDGDIWELVDILEEEVDKTPAFREDGSPIESRPRGFASSNRSTLDNATSQDLARIVNADAKHRGFASSSSEWKKTTHDIDGKREPETELAHSNGSRTTQKRVNVGNEVIHPRTGDKVKLDSPSASVDYVSFGGKLSDVPDEHLIESILRNSIDLPGEYRSGWNLSKPDGRFEVLSTGGGVHGMILLRDRTTGAQLGIKFEASTNYGMNMELIPIDGHSDRDSVFGIVTETIANTISEELGFPPMPMRIVRRSRLGAGELDAEAPAQRPGIALVTELAQNRHRRIIGDGGLLVQNRTTQQDVRPISAVRVGLMDALLGNKDRNIGNYLISAQRDGSVVIVPIDHGETLQFDEERSLSRLILDTFGDGFHFRTFRNLSRNQMLQVISDVMKDYRKELPEKHERIRAEVQKILRQATRLMMEANPPGEDWVWIENQSTNLYMQIEEVVNTVLRRWTELANMSNDEITEILYNQLTMLRMGRLAPRPPRPLIRSGFASSSSDSEGKIKEMSRSKSIKGNKTSYYFIVQSTPTFESVPVLFIYTTENNDADGVYTAYSSDESAEEYWNDWLQKRYLVPGRFVNRFGYRSVTAGKVRDEDHLDELFKKARIQNRTIKGKSLDWVELSTKDFLSNAPTIEFKDGSYTKPQLRENIKRRIMAGSKGGAPGQWSARKAQLVAIAYRKAGGGYRGKPRKTQRSLKKWTREKWTTSDGKPAIRKGGTRRYLPASAWRSLTPAQRAATNRKKVKGSRSGNQFVRNTEAAARAGRNARRK